ncbi:MAG TPA: metallophosphoesterase [Gemmatimonadales bacterium]|nr:metallophosphoesterase [Gemmatimonadales bacterium]
MALIYLLLFISPQVLLYLYLRDRLPDPGRPRQGRAIRRTLAVVFVVFNLPWLIVAVRMFSGSLWGISRTPYIAPWIAWQLLGWVFCGLVTVYLLGKLLLWGSRELGAVLSARRVPRSPPLPAPGSLLSRRRFLARATYAYAAAGLGLSAYGIWSAERLPAVTRRTLVFPDLPPGLDGLRIAHLSDVHAGIHMLGEKMERIVAQTNALRPDLIVQTGDMIDISASFIPEYVRAFRDLQAPLGVVTVLGNHDRYTGEHAVIRGVRDAGQVFVLNGAHVIERGGAALALVGIDDPRNWRADDPQDGDLDAALHRAPPATEAFRILLAHRPGAFDGAAPRGIPLTLAGHIHGGQFYLPVIGWSPGRLITKYVMGHFRQGASQLYVSRGIGVVGVPLRVFVPPEIALFELRRAPG